jgi:hypothetical protein
MARYTVTLTETSTYEVTVDAKDHCDAEVVAKEEFAKDPVGYFKDCSGPQTTEIVPG